MLGDVGLHMVLEAIGGALAYYAYGFCGHWRHRLMVWFLLSLMFSYVTVRLIG